MGLIIESKRMASEGKGKALSQRTLGSDPDLDCGDRLRRRQWHPTPAFLPGESQGRGSLVGCRLWGRTESATTEATQQQQWSSKVIHLVRGWR